MENEKQEPEKVNPEPRAPPLKRVLPAITMMVVKVNRHTGEQIVGMDGETAKAIKLPPGFEYQLLGQDPITKHEIRGNLILAHPAFKLGQKITI